MRGFQEIGYEDELVGSDEVEAMLGEAYGQNRWAAGAAPVAMTPYRGGGQMNPYAMAMARRRAQSQSLIKEKQWTKSRQYPVGLDSVTTIAGLASATISTQPQVLFRPERLVVDGGIAGSFVINSFVVGKNSQFVASGSLPASAFAPTSFGVRLKCDTCQVSGQISLNVTNISAGALRFLAAVFGEAVE